MRLTLIKNYHFAAVVPQPLQTILGDARARSHRLPVGHNSMNVESGNSNSGDKPSSQQDTPEYFRLAYDTLHALAARYLRGERLDHTLQPTALVHEAFLKLDNGKSNDWKGKTHFQAIAARAMRQILVDHARQHRAQKRGGNWQRISLSAGELGDQRDIDFIAIDEALKNLAELNQRKADVVELRFFGGMTIAEAADQLGVSPKTAEADWYFARAWLRKQLKDPS